jgi:hypothetical protein
VLRSSVSLMFICLAFSNACLACECIERTRPCEYLQTDVVFVGQVLETTSVKHPVNADSWSLGYSMHFAVDESLRGEVGSDVNVETGNGGGDCGTPLPPGGRFLIFAYRNKSGELWTGMCSGDRLLANDVSSEQIVNQYRTLIRSGVATIFGKVVSSKPVWKGDEVADGAGPKPVRGVVVNARSKNFTTTATTSQDGSYQFDRLPNGQYTIVPEISSSVDFDHEDEDKYGADVSDGGCADVTFKLQPKTRIQGHLALPEGLKLKLVEVVAIPIHLQHLNQFSGQWDLTDEDNNFTIWPLPPGDYYVGVNIGSSPKVEAPFPPTYYPGVTNQNAARVVRLKEGETKQLELNLPKVATPRKVSFVAIGLDGKPLRSIYVQLEDLRHPGDASSYVNVDLDTSGTGTLTVYSGYRYHLHGSHYVRFGADWCSKPVLIEAGSEPVAVQFVMDREVRSCEIIDVDNLRK